MSYQTEAQIWESAGITPLPYAHAMYRRVDRSALAREGMGAHYRRAGSISLADPDAGFRFLDRELVLSGELGSGFVQGLTGDAAGRGWLVAIYSVAKRLLLIPGLVVLALWSAWSHRSRWRELLPLYIFPIGLMLGYIPFTVEAGRYALPVLPCLMVLSVAVLVQAGLPMVSLCRRQPLPMRP